MGTTTCLRSSDQERIMVIAFDKAKVGTLLLSLVLERALVLWCQYCLTKMTSFANLVTTSLV